MMSPTPRHASFLTSLLLLSLSPVCLCASEVLYQAVVDVPEVEVRCGPGDNAQLYVTNRLDKGTRVEVVKETPNGWLAIAPPVGSFSWINKNFVRQITPSESNWVVTTAPDVRVPVLIGSEVNPGRPTVKGTSLQRGAQVRAIGAEQTDDEGVWLPIESPASELRYLRASAVRKATASEAVAAASPKAKQSSFSLGATKTKAPTRPKRTSSSIDLLWQQAQEAERVGRYADAVQLYTRIGTEGIKSHHDLAMQALNRAYWLKNAGRNQQVYGTATSRPTSNVPPPKTRLSAPASAYEVSRDMGTKSTWTPNGQNQPARLYSSGPGVLRAAGRTIEGQTTYVLESTQGYPRLYVTAGRGVNLGVYVNRMVELVGPSVYRGDLRANYMVAERIQPLN